MNEEIEVEVNGATYSAEYSVFGETLVTYFPDGTNIEVELKGLNAESTARAHLRKYASKSNT